MLISGDNLGGDGTSVGGGATFVVAALNATTAERASADYICDGVDDQVQINQAINDLPTQGGSIRLTGGLFDVSAAIDVNKRSTVLYGSGKDSSSTRGTTIRRSGATGYAVDVTAQYCKLAELEIYDSGGVANSSPLVRFTSGGLDAFVDRVVIFSFQTAGVALHIESGRTYIENSLVGGDGGGVTFGSGSSIFATNCTFNSFTSGYCIDLNNAAVSGTEYWIDRCIIQGIGGVRIDGGSGQTVHIRDCFIEAQGALHAVYIDNPSRLTIRGNHITCPSSALDGIRVQTASTSSTSIIAGNVISLVSQHGIALNGVSGCVVEGNRINGVSRTTDDTYAGIILEANTDLCTVVNNQIRRGASGNMPKYGIRVDASTCDNNFVTNNDLLNSSKSGGTGAAYSDAGTGTVTTAGNRV